MANGNGGKFLLEAIKSVGFPIVMCFVLMYLVFYTIPNESNKIIKVFSDSQIKIVENQSLILQLLRSK